MLPFISKPTKNLIWTRNMWHSFQLVGENFFCSCTVCLGKCLCKYPFLRFINTMSPKSAVGIQRRKLLLHLGRKSTGQESSFLVCQMWVFLFPGAQKLWEGGSGSSSSHSNVRCRSWSEWFEMQALCWTDGLAVLRGRHRAVLLREGNVPLSPFY